MERSMNQSQATAIALSEDLIFVGTSLGQLWMYARDTQEPYDVFMEKGKEFQNNPITCLAVHPSRMDYVLVGY